jgi:hypothetical protein
MLVKTLPLPMYPELFAADVDAIDCMDVRSVSEVCKRKLFQPLLKKQKTAFLPSNSIMLSNIPTDILNEIAALLGLGSLICISRSNKELHEIADRYISRQRGLIAGLIVDPRIVQFERRLIDLDCFLTAVSDELVEKSMFRLFRAIEAAPIEHEHGRRFYFDMLTVLLARELRYHRRANPRLDVMKLQSILHLPRFIIFGGEFDGVAEREVEVCSSFFFDESRYTLLIQGTEQKEKYSNLTQHVDSVIVTTDGRLFPIQPKAIEFEVLAGFDVNLWLRVSFECVICGIRKDLGDVTDAQAMDQLCCLFCIDHLRNAQFKALVLSRGWHPGRSSSNKQQSCSPPAPKRQRIF